MFRKTVSGMMLTLLLISMFTLAFNIQPVKASGTIYIRADGSVDPPTAPIQRDGDIYTFTDNIYDSIVVERNNIVIDGNGYTLQGSGTGIGIYLSGRENVTVRNTQIKDFYHGILLGSSSNNRISGNSITANNYDGIGLYASSANSISGNSIANNGYGIRLNSEYNDNCISANNITNNGYGIYLNSYFPVPSRNKIYHNNFINNVQQVLFIGELSGNNVWDDGYPSGGNYWSDYTGVDANGDGIGDTPYVIDANNQDHYPLMNPWTPTSPWPMFQHDPQHTGRSPYVGPSHSPEAEILLGNQTFSELFGSPAIDSDGTLYFGKSGVPEYGLYASRPDGTQKWYCKIVPGAGLSLLDPPALFEPAKTVYAQNDTEVFAVGTESGNLRWKRSFARVYGFLALAENGIVYFSALRQLPDDSYRNYLIGLDQNGEEVLSYEIGEGSPSPSPPTIDKEGTIYVGYNDTLFAVNPEGTERWHRRFEGHYTVNYTLPIAPTVTMPSISEDGTVYVLVECETDWVGPTDSGFSAHLHAIDSQNPLVDKWSRRLGMNYDYSSPPPALDSEGNVYTFWGIENVMYEDPDMYVDVLNPAGILLDAVHLGHCRADLLVVDAENTIYVMRRSISGNASLYIRDSEGKETAVVLPSHEGYFKSPISLSSDGALYIGGHKNLYVVKSTVSPPAPNIPPMAKFSYSPSEPNVGNEITFDASDSHDPDGFIVSYEWDFGDGNSANGELAAHSYLSAGDYTASLTVTDDKQAVTTTTKIILVATVLPNQSPHAFFTVTPGNPKQGEETKLDASQSSDSDGAIKYYEWDLDGDGTYDGFTTSSRIYFFWEESGTYNVRLRVTDDDEATEVFTKSISIQKYSFWEKAKRLLAPTVEELSETEKQRFMKIKSELHIGNYPHSSDPLSDTDFYWYCDDQLIQVLRKKIMPETSDLTYETLIIDILHDMELADSVANRPWTVNPIIEAYFENMAEINAWADVPLLMIETLADGILDQMGGTGIGVGEVLALWDISQALVGLEFLDDTFYRRALWHYFQLRGMDYSVQEAYGSSPVPLKYDSDATRDYFESLWTEYGGSQISEYGGLRTDFKEQIIVGLRTLLISGLEIYKFEPIQRYSIKSPAQLRIYDSIGRVTGQVNGEIKEQIPNSIYDNETETVLIYPANDTYRCQIVGLEQGTYALQITNSKDGEATAFDAIAIPTTIHATHLYIVDWSVLAQGQQGVTVQVDSEGDGVFENTFTSDGELTQSEFLDQTAPPPLSVSISPLSDSILVGQSVTFTSTVSGGYTPYSYQWYLNGNPVSGATSNTWAFTPTTSGIHYVHLKVTDAKANTAQSDTARITTATVPVGGYSISIQLPTTAKPVTSHIALLTILTAIFITIKRKTKRKH